MRADRDRTLRAAGLTLRLNNGRKTIETGVNATAWRNRVQLTAGWRRISGIVSDESGQALVLAAVCMTVLMGVMALAVDVGYVHYRMSQLQTAADSAAIAAGLELGNCSDAVCANMKTAAAQALIEDGITSATLTPTSNCTVSNSSSLAMVINVSPCVLGASDPNYGNAHIAEVVLTEPQKMFFGSILGIPKMNLVARAEAGDSYINTSNSGGNCIYVNNGVEFNSSNGAFSLNNCSMYDGGSLQTDNGDSVKASTFLYYGTWSPNNCNGSCTWTLGDSETQPTHTTTTQNDPLAALAPPTQPANSSTYTNTTPNSGATLQPGNYPNGINLNSGVSVTLAPGVYYMNGSINVDSGATLTGTGVTLYFASGSLQPNSGSVVQLTAPTTSTNGGNANMVVWESSSNSTGMYLDAGSTSYYNGVIYLPDAGLTLNSGSGSTINGGSTATAVDVQNLMVDSGITFVVNGSGGYLGGGVGQTLGSFALAE
jgi:Flp pilus assembly protein TadG